MQESGHSSSKRLALHRDERVQRGVDEYRRRFVPIAPVRADHFGVRRRRHAHLDVDHHGPLSSIHTQSSYFRFQTRHRRRRELYGAVHSHV